MTKCRQRYKDTWWWNRDVEEVVAKPKVCPKAWLKSKSAEDKHSVCCMKKYANKLETLLVMHKGSNTYMQSLGIASQ